MKTKLLYAALFISPAVFGQDAKVSTTQAAQVKTEVKTGDKASLNGSGSLNSAGTIQATQSAVNAGGQTAAGIRSMAVTGAKQQQQSVKAKTSQAVSTTSQQVSRVNAATDLQSSAAVSAGGNNKMNAAASVNNAAVLSARPVKSHIEQSGDVAVKTGKVHASTSSAVKSAAAVKPHPVKVKSAVRSNNSTLLKIK